MTQPFQYQNNTLTCEGLPLDRLAERYGTPLYVYSRPAIVERCRMIEAALGDIPHIAYYAVKANANPELMQAIAGEHFGADVGSRGELFLALRAGFAPEKISFSGVGKRDDEIEEALHQGIHAFNVESAEEIEVISAVASRLGKRARILLRVNLDIDAGGHAYISTSRRQNKFGVPHAQAPAMLRWASGLPSVEVQGVHSHIGSQITDVGTFLAAARALVETVRAVRDAGVPVRELDFGGGYGVRYHGALSHPGLPEEQPDHPVIPVPEMVKAIIPVLRQAGCTVAVQPGRSIVGEAGALIVRVLYRKQGEGKTFIIVDGAMNDLIRPSLYGAHHQVVPVTLRGEAAERVDVVGPVCESGDFFAQDRPVPRSVRGDTLAILSAGAYGYVIASNYNARLRAAEVLLETGGATLIRPREALEDLLP